MKGWIANTHHDWFDFLAQKRFWPEVNFWTPSDYFAFHGEPGSPFFFMPLTLVSGIYGMNIHLPQFPGSDAAQFWWLAGIMVAIVGMMLAFFRRNRWI